MAKNGERYENEGQGMTGMILCTWFVKARDSWASRRAEVRVGSETVEVEVRFALGHSILGFSITGKQYK